MTHLCVRLDLLSGNDSSVYFDWVFIFYNWGHLVS